MMNIKKPTQAFLALLALSLAAFAQQGAQPAGKGKIALINTAAFQEQVGEFRVKIEALNKQFEPRIKELEQLGGRIQSIENTIKQGALSAAKVAELTEQV